MLIARFPLRSFCFLLLLASNAAGGEPTAPPKPQLLENPHGAARKAILERVAVARKRLEALRGLPFKGEVKIAVVTPEQMRKSITKAMDKNNDPQVFVSEGRVFKALGLIPESTDYKAMMTGEIGNIASGSYDQWEKTLRLILGRDPAAQETTIAHELHHGLQHQHWPDLMDGKTVSGRDSGNAVRALIEADAMMTQEAYVLDQAGIGLSAYRVFLGEKYRRDRNHLVRQMRSRGTPPYFVDKNSFEYAGAVNFVHVAYKQGGWKAVDAVLSDPPISTEQVLHPERYFTRRDYPVTLGLPDLKKHLTKTYGDDNVDQDSAGELLIRSIFRTHLGAGHDDAATGWDGDTCFVWHNPTTMHNTTVWATQWDSMSDASEFAKAMVQTLQKRQGVEFKSQPNGEAGVATHEAQTKDHRALRISQVGTRVTVFDGIVPDDEAVWAMAGKPVLTYDKRDTQKGADDAKALEPLVKPRPPLEGKAPFYGNGSRRYENYRFQWTADLPAGAWIAQHPLRDDADAHRQVWFMMLEKVRRIQIQVHSRQVEMDLTPEQRIKRIESIRSIQVDNYERLAGKSVEINGMKGSLYVYQGTHRPPLPRVRLQHDMYVLADDKREIIIEIPAVPGWSTKRRKEIEAFFQGLEILHPKRKWPEPRIGPGKTYVNEEFNFQVSAGRGWEHFFEGVPGLPNQNVEGRIASTTLYFANVGLHPKVNIRAEKVGLNFNLTAKVDADIQVLAKDPKTQVEPKEKASAFGLKTAYKWGYMKPNGKTYCKVFDFVANHIHYRIELRCLGKASYNISKHHADRVLDTFKFVRPAR